METVLLVVAGGAVCLAILIAIANKIKGSPTKEERPAGSMYFAPVTPVIPVAMGGARFQANSATDQAVADRAAARAKRGQRLNRRGWRAPEGHYFDDDDCLFTDAGDAILDLVIMAQLCGESYDPSEESAPTEEFATGVSSECTAASCCSETSAEITSGSLQTETSSEPRYGGGDSDSFSRNEVNSYDSGSDDGGSGDD